MRILSISSQVVLGHVGNSALALPLARLGVEFYAVPTVLFSNHLGYPTYGGGALDTDLVRRLLDGLEGQGLPQRLDGVISGYLGRGDNAQLVAERIARWRQQRPDLPYLLDPVMGDMEPGEEGRLYVPGEVPAMLRQNLLPLADWTTPNPFELSLLTQSEPAHDEAGLRAQAERLLTGRRQGVLVTSVVEGDRIGFLLVLREGAWRLLAPRLRFEIVPNGSGDLLAGLFLVEILKGAPPLVAARRTLGRLHALLRETQRLGGRELAQVAAQEILAKGEENGVEVSVLD
jgi:pyridoxine kinase